MLKYIEGCTPTALLEFLLVNAICEDEKDADHDWGDYWLSRLPAQERWRRYLMITAWMVKVYDDYRWWYRHRRIVRNILQRRH